MKLRLRFAGLALAGLIILPQIVPAASVKTKDEAAASVDRHQADLIGLSDQVWSFAETALLETRSAKLLADYLEKQGFTLERGLPGLPTAFIASYGQGRPVIGVLGEYDALPGLSQKAVPQKEVLEQGAAGQGCGHNLLGAGALGAALAIKDLMAAGRLKGTIRFYGTPAEEAVGGKIYMVREGQFKDLDACLTWHPSEENRVAVDGSQAIVDFTVEFKGRTAHAAADPWNGRSAVAAMEFFTTGLNRMREFVKPTVRMHYSILNGGDVPNVVPAYARIWVWLRDSKGAGVSDLLARARKIAEGAALMAEAESKITINSGDWETLVNVTGAKLVYDNMVRLGPVPFTREEQDFAKKIQQALGIAPLGLMDKVAPWREPLPDPEGGSTDVGDASWQVPMMGLGVTTAPVYAAWHAWPVVACAGMSIGHKAILYSAKVLATTMVDLYENPKALEAVKAEFREKTKGVVYKAFIPDGPPTLLKR